LTRATPLSHQEMLLELAVVRRHTAFGAHWAQSLVVRRSASSKHGCLLVRELIEISEMCTLCTSRFFLIHFHHTCDKISSQSSGCVNFTFRSENSHGLRHCLVKLNQIQLQNGRVAGWETAAYSKRILHISN